MGISLHLDSPVQKKKDSTIILGNCFWRDDRNKSIIKLISESTTLGELRDILNNLTGFFTIIKKVESGFFIATDYINSHPLYYSISNEKYITDSGHKVTNLSDRCEFDPISHVEYKTASYATGPHTLFKSIKQTQPGEICHITPENVERYSYFNFEYGEQRQRTVEDVHNNWSKVISRAINYADERPIWVPLSGGFDSRYILTELVRQGYENLHAFSWASRPAHDENKTAERVASSLNVDFHSIELSHDDWHMIYRSNGRLAIDQKFWLSSAPVLREWAAVRRLVEKEKLSENSVIIPGHSGDMVAGSHLSRISNMNRDQSDIVEMIIKKHYRYDDTDVLESKIKKRIRDVIGYSDHSELSHFEAFERFDWRERQSKWITRSTTAHEVTGVNWWIPFWDAECVDFWLNTQIKQRQGRYFQVDAVQSLYQKVAENPIGYKDVDSITDEVKNNIIYSRWKPTFKKPYDIALKIKQLLAPTDDRSLEQIYNESEYRFGVMSYERFREVYNGNSDHRAYRIQALLGEIDLEARHPVDCLNIIR